MMRHLLAGVLLAFPIALAGLQAAGAKAIAIGNVYEERARHVIADLDHFLGRFADFAEGTTDPAGRRRPPSPTRTASGRCCAWPSCARAC